MAQSIRVKIQGKEELLQLLYNLQNNCGDIKGNNGEYLDVQVEAIIKVADNLDAEWEE